MSQALILGRSATNATIRHPVLAVILVYGAAATALMLVRARVNPGAFRIDGPEWAGVIAVVDIVCLTACLVCLVRGGGKQRGGRVEVLVGAAVLVAATASVVLFAVVRPVLASVPPVPSKPGGVASVRPPRSPMGTLVLVLDPVRPPNIGSTAVVTGSIRGETIPSNAEICLSSRSRPDASWRWLGTVRPGPNRRFRAALSLRRPNEDASRALEIVACLGQPTCEYSPGPDGVCTWPSQIVSVLQPTLRITHMRVRPSREGGLRTLEVEGEGRHLDDGDTIWLQVFGSTDRPPEVQPILRNGRTWFARVDVERGPTYVYAALSDSHPGFEPIAGATRASLVVR